jgi:hypothetical protein
MSRTRQTANLSQETVSLPSEVLFRLRPRSHAGLLTGGLLTVLVWPECARAVLLRPPETAILLTLDELEQAICLARASAL